LKERSSCIRRTTETDAVIGCNTAARKKQTKIIAAPDPAKKGRNATATGAFARRLGRFAAIAMLILAFALSLGIAGYHWIADLDWVDAILNASMILTGMGPVAELRTAAAKLFASAYALFSGLVFITVMGVILTPVVQRTLNLIRISEQRR
jgi:hypothetical protein